MPPTNPGISICIPVYKRVHFLQRLMASIAIQEYKDFEVIVTDDSPDDSVKNLCDRFAGQFSLTYFKNEVPLGTPENWNESIRRASGRWIKLMHDDDWFTDGNSLESFAQYTTLFPGAKFIFSAYRNQFLERGTAKPMSPNSFRLWLLQRNAATLFSENIIGPPSVTLFSRDLMLYYDKDLKWRVDIEFYMRVLKEARFVYLDKPLVQVGIGSEQVTQDCFGKRIVEIPENFYLLDRLGVRILRNYFVYDAWWRLMRNLEIKSVQDIKESGYFQEVPRAIKRIIERQRKIPASLLKNGLVSKSLMTLSYLFSSIK